MTLFSTLVGYVHVVVPALSSRLLVVGEYLAKRNPNDVSTTIFTQTYVNVIEQQLAIRSDAEKQIDRAALAAGLPFGSKNSRSCARADEYWSSLSVLASFGDLDIYRTYGSNVFRRCPGLENSLRPAYQSYSVTIGGTGGALSGALGGISAGLPSFYEALSALEKAMGKSR